MIYSILQILEQYGIAILYNALFNIPDCVNSHEYADYRAFYIDNNPGPDNKHNSVSNQRNYSYLQDRMDLAKLNNSIPEQPMWYCKYVLKDQTCIVLDKDCDAFTVVKLIQIKRPDYTSTVG